MTEGRKKSTLKEKARAEHFNKGSSRGRNLQPLTRVVGERPERMRFLIVCEGKKTEPNYFEWLKTIWKVQGEVKTNTSAGFSLKIIDGQKAPKNVVERAIREKKKNNSYDQVWAVFDCDDFGDDNLKTAFELAKANDIKIAFSNPCFEIWFLLHFREVDSNIARNTLFSLIKNHIECLYDKTDDSIHDHLIPHLDKAMTRAKALAKKQCGNRENPYTGIYLLIDELHKSGIYSGKLPYAYIPNKNKSPLE